MSRKTPAFEDAIKELEQLVERLEHGQMGLDDALKTFERGVQLTRACQTALSEAEQKVQILMDSGDAPALKPFVPPEHS